MHTTWAICKREVRTYFNSPVAYIVATFFLVPAGYLFFSQLFIEKQADLRGFFNFAPLLFLFFAPAMTMRLLADEKGSGTLELLVTMPVREWEVVVGKYMAALALLGTIVVLTMAYFVTVAALGPIDKGATFGGYFGLMLLGGAYLAIGVMASSLTKNQIVSAILAFAISFGLFLIGRLTQVLPESLQNVASYLSLVDHFENIQRGVIDSRDLVYYFSLIGVSLLVATTALSSRKWS